MTVAGMPGALEATDGRPVREADELDVVAGRVHAADERPGRLLGAAVGAGGEDLDDADALAVAERRPVGELEAGVGQRRRGHRVTRTAATSSR